MTREKALRRQFKATHDDPLMRKLEADDIEQLRCYREICALAFKTLTRRMKRYGLSELQKEKFADIIEDLAELVRDKG